LPQVQLDFQKETLNGTVHATALVDSGASENFIDEDFARWANLSLFAKTTPLRVEIIDGSNIASGHISHETRSTPLTIPSVHREKINLNLIASSHFAVILGEDHMVLLLQFLKLREVLSVQPAKFYPQNFNQALWKATSISVS
jgi:hypothetical protein